MCVKIMIDATHLTSTSNIPSVGPSYRSSVAGNGLRKCLPAYLSIPNQMLATSRTKQSRTLLGMLAHLGHGYTKQEKKSQAFKTRQYTLMQQQLSIVGRLF